MAYIAMNSVRSCEAECRSCNIALANTALEAHTRITHRFSVLWFSISIAMVTLMLASPLFIVGMNWKQDVFFVLLGNTIVLLAIFGTTRCGINYSIQFLRVITDYLIIPSRQTAVVQFCRRSGVRTRSLSLCMAAIRQLMLMGCRSLCRVRLDRKRSISRGFSQINLRFLGLALFGFAAATSGHAQVNTVAHAQATSGMYTLRADKPQQVIKGIGFEIQNDSIGSLNLGMPEEVAGVPHDLTPAERKRFYKQMLHGFRYTRLALGLYLRGLDAEQKHIIERYPGQMNDLREMQKASGIEGFDVEYWSAAPFWKDSKSYYGGTVASHDNKFFDDFSDSLVADVRYLQGHGLRIAQWGLQNEPVFGDSPLQGEKVAPGSRPKMPYAIMHYSPQDYASTLQFAIPKLRVVIPNAEIHANSWDGPSGDYAAEIRKKPSLLASIDAWTWHQVGSNANLQIDKRDMYMDGAGNKPVYSNEFEYQPADLKNFDSPFMNTGQSLMNWMVFENSPTWFWLHALKPVTNMEAAGYALGFWRPPGVLKTNLRPNLAPGHWEFNPQNWNALAGFLKYLPWDSTRLEVEEKVVQHDQRILVWRSKKGKLGMTLSNRATESYTFHVKAGHVVKLTGHRYTVTTLDTPAGTQQGADISITVAPQGFEFWIER